MYFVSTEVINRNKAAGHKFLSIFPLFPINIHKFIRCLQSYQPDFVIVLIRCDRFEGDHLEYTAAVAHCGDQHRRTADDTDRQMLRVACLDIMALRKRPSGCGVPWNHHQIVAAVSPAVTVPSRPTEISISLTLPVVVPSAEMVQPMSSRLPPPLRTAVTTLWFRVPPREAILTMLTAPA